MRRTNKHDSNLTMAERQRRLQDASDRYLRGEMSALDFHQAEERYMTNYRAATLELARRAARPTKRKVRVA